MGKANLKVILIVGNRPQFVKLMPLISELKRRKNVSYKVIHTGQHYDYEMSQIFFKQFKFKKPEYLFHLRESRQGAQTALMLKNIETVLLKEKADIIVVFGDTNSTLAGALAASKLGIKIAHIESGLRSFNKSMPEEINRVITDNLSYYLFCPTENAVSNLSKEGINKNVFLVGDIMVDSLKMCIRKKQKPDFQIPDKYYLATIHRNYNTDDKERLKYIFEYFENLDFPVVFPVHPRTKAIIPQRNIRKFKNIIFEKPAGYFEMLYLMSMSYKILTDSGGMQKEAYILKKPCVTLRTETEWIETIKSGCNKLLKFNGINEDIKTTKTFNPRAISYSGNIFGSGDTSRKILDILLKYQNAK